MDYSDEELEWALWHLDSSDEHTANKACSILLGWLQRTQTYRIQRIVPNSAVDDVIQNVLAKIWQGRGKLEYRGLLRWKVLIRLMVHQACVDWLKKNREVQFPKDFDIGIPDKPEPSREYLDKLCGEVWLGYPRDLPLNERNRRVLAVQLHYENDELSWDQIWQLVHNREATPRDRETYEGWLADDALLRDYAFRALYAGGPEIVRELLNLQETLDLFELASQSLDGDRDERFCPGWTHAEVAAIVWRFGFDSLRAQTLARPDNRLTEQEFDELCVRCEGNQMFNNRMQRLLKSLGHQAQSVFAKQRVYKRLAYEYGIRNSIPQRDVHWRMAGPAALAGYILTMATLNAWISGGRLEKELGGAAADD